MKLQKGRFLIKSINDIKNIQKDSTDMRKLIDLEYMGQFEYEGVMPYLYQECLLNIIKKTIFLSHTNI